jgi:hypothetical protein
MGKKRLEQIEEAYEKRDEKSYYDGDRKPMFTDKFPEWKCKEGENYIKILPTKEERLFGMPIHIHWNVGINNDAFLCPKRTEKKSCPICEHQAKLMKGLEAGEKWDEEIKTFFPRDRIVYLIIDTRDDETIEEGIQIYAAPIKKVHKEGILPLCRKSRTGEIIDISDPNNELEVIFTREGTGQTDTSYGGFKTDKSNLNLEEVKEFIKELPDKFEDILNLAPYEEIKEAFDGIVEKDDDGLSDEEDVPMEQEEEASRTRRRRSRKESSSELTEDKDSPEEEEDEKARKKRQLREEVRKRSRRGKDSD